MDELIQMNNLEKKLSDQKSNLKDFLFILKQKEIDGQTCKCKHYCRIYHEKHTYIKSKSEEFLTKLNKLSEASEDSGPLSGATKKLYTRKQCEKQFAKNIANRDRPI